jgi:hypothetical protein
LKNSDRNFLDLKHDEYLRGQLSFTDECFLESQSSFQVQLKKYIERLFKDKWMNKHSSTVKEYLADYRPLGSSVLNRLDAGDKLNWGHWGLWFCDLCAQKFDLNNLFRLRWEEDENDPRTCSDCATRILNEETESRKVVKLRVAPGAPLVPDILEKDGMCFEPWPELGELREYSTDSTFWVYEIKYPDNEKPPSWVRGRQERKLYHLYRDRKSNLRWPLNELHFLRKGETIWYRLNREVTHGQIAEAQGKLVKYLLGDETYGDLPIDDLREEDSTIDNYCKDDVKSINMDIIRESLECEDFRERKRKWGLKYGKFSWAQTTFNSFFTTPYHRSHNISVLQNNLQFFIEHLDLKSYVKLSTVVGHL